MSRSFRKALHFAVQLSEHKDNTQRELECRAAIYAKGGRERVKWGRKQAPCRKADERLLLAH